MDRRYDRRLYGWTCPLLEVCEVRDDGAKINVGEPVFVKNEQMPIKKVGKNLVEKKIDEEMVVQAT